MCVCERERDRKRQRELERAREREREREIERERERERGLEGLSVSGEWFARIRNLPNTLSVSVPQKSVVSICQNGLSGCAHP